MFEDLYKPTRDELEEKITDQTRIISDPENELIGREREIRDSGKRNGEYVEMMDNMKEIIQRYFDKPENLYMKNGKRNKKTSLKWRQV
jgi:hypothetical protein